MDRAERIRRNERALTIVALAEEAGRPLHDSTRRGVNALYTGLGGLIETNLTGLAGLAEAREKGYAQFFTPPAVGTLAAELLRIPDGATVFDPAIGSGRMLFDLHERLHITGIEIEREAYRVCRACLPDAAVVEDDFINHLVEDTFDYAIGNPPFSITLHDQRRRYRNTNWEGKIPSHLAWLELAVRAVRSRGFIAAVLPKEVLAAADTISFHRWLNTEAREVARIHLPPGTFLATDWPCLLSLYEKHPIDSSVDRFDYVLPSLTNTADLPTAWRTYLGKHQTVRVASYAALVSPKAGPVALTIARPAVGPRDRPMAALPLYLSDEVRIIPGERVKLRPNGLIAALALEEVRLAAKTDFDRKRKVHVNAWDQLRRQPFLRHETEVVERLASAGLALWMEEADDHTLRRRRRWFEREERPLERHARIKGEWAELFVTDGLTAHERPLFDAWMKRAVSLGLDRFLYPFQLVDICRMAMKRSVLLALQQGLGKTRVVIALQLLLGSKRGLYVVPSKLIGEWENEFRALALPVRVIDSLAATRDPARHNLVAYEALWRVPKDSPWYGRGDDSDAAEEEGTRTRHLKHTLATVIRRRFPYIALDEAYYVKNPDALRTRAVYHLRAKHKIAMTGTPIKGYPQNILGLLNWTFGSGSALLPDYSYYDEGGVKRFLERFGTYVYYDAQHEKTGDKGKKKQLPKIKDVEGFYELLRAKMIRRLKNEPAVAAVIPTADPIVEYVPIPIEGDHRRFYEAWLKDFLRWYQARLEEEHLGGKRLGKMEILAKLGYLIQAATIPQSPNLIGATSFIAPYDGGPTSLQAWAILRVKEAILAGEKVIVFSRFLESLTYLERQLKYLKPITITGSVSLTRKKGSGKSERQELVEAFRSTDAPVLLAGTACLSEGMNIPEASVGVFCDYDWTPSVMFQALFRMVRPQQKRQVRGYFLTLTGTIAEYMQTICELKQKAIDEGIDYTDNDFAVGDVPDIEQYCKAIVGAGAHVPEKRQMRLDTDPTPEEVPDDCPEGGDAPVAPLPEAP